MIRLLVNCRFKYEHIGDDSYFYKDNYAIFLRVAPDANIKQETERELKTLDFFKPQVISFTAQNINN